MHHGIETSEHSPASISSLDSHNTVLPPPSTCTASEAGELPERHVLTPSRAEQEYLNRLPGFIKPFGRVLDGSDWEFLRAKGALTLPTPYLQAALIRAYLEHIQPLLPVLDVGDFLQSFNARSGQLSLLLFQSVLFAGSAFVDVQLLVSAGFQTRTEARKVFLDRARLLYDFGSEKNHLTVIQSLLLLTLWHELPSQHRNVAHWINVAISQAFASELHLEPSLIQPKIPAKLQKLRRRLWWSCVIRDRLACLGTGRAPMIRDGDSNVYMLELADFEFDHVYFGNSKLPEIACSYIWDEDRREELARICIAQAKVCRCVRVPPLDKSTFESYQRDLLGWYDSLSHWEQFRPLTTSEFEHDGDASAEFNRAILHVIYHTACLRLHQTRLTVLLHDAKTSKFDLELLKIDMQHSICRLDEVIRNIQEVKPTLFLSTLEMAFVVSAKDIDFMSGGALLQANHTQGDGCCRCTQIVDSIPELGSVSSPSIGSDPAKTPTDSASFSTYGKDAMESTHVPLTHEEMLPGLLRAVFVDEFMPSIMKRRNQGEEPCTELSDMSQIPDCVLEGLGPLYEMFLAE